MIKILFGLTNKIIYIHTIWPNYVPLTIHTSINALTLDPSGMFEYPKSQHLVLLTQQGCICRLLYQNSVQEALTYSDAVQFMKNTIQWLTMQHM